MKQEEQQPANVTDVALWKLARTVHERHQHDTDTDTCGFCGETWPCEAEQRAQLADAAARRPVDAPVAKPARVASGAHAAGPAPVASGAPKPAPADSKAENSKRADSKAAEEPVAAGGTRHTPMWRRLSRPHRKAG
jgi:hypothetical protein